MSGRWQERGRVIFSVIYSNLRPHENTTLSSTAQGRNKLQGLHPRRTGECLTQRTSVHVTNAGPCGCAITDAAEFVNSGHRASFKLVGYTCVSEVCPHIVAQPLSAGYSFPQPSLWRGPRWSTPSLRYGFLIVSLLGVQKARA